MTVDTMQKARAAMASHGAASVSASRALNIFRLAADLVHLASIVILGMKMSKTRSCSGNTTHSFCRHFTEEPDSLLVGIRDPLPGFAQG